MEQLRKLGSRMHVGWHRRKDGSTFPVEVNITYVRLNRDYIVAVVRDVTERRRAEEELRRTADMLRALADGTTDAVFVKDRNGECLLMNESAARFVGKSVAEVLGIVRGHRGTLKVRSAPGQGTTFEVFFPRSTRAPEAATPASVAKGRAEGIVLVAADEAAIRAVTRAVLTRAGLGVIEARDGREAVEVFRQHRAEVGCVLLDLTMPRLSGIEALAEIRAIAPAVPVVVMSGYSPEELAGRFAGTPLIGIIQKPIRPDHLVGLMRKALCTPSDQ